MNTHPDLAVVVCSYNGAARIGACLDALYVQTVRPRLEILVVDDGSTDATARIARELGFRVVSQGTNQGLSAARNAGIAATTAPIVAFTDDDCVPGPTWAEDLLAAWATAPASVQGIGGEVACAIEATFAQRYLSASSPLAPLEFSEAAPTGLVGRLRAYFASRGPRPRRGSRSVYAIVGANMSFRRDALAAIGGFDPAIRFGGDEEYVSVEIRRHFGDDALLVVPSVVMAHDFHPELRDSLRRSWSYGKGIGRDWARHGGIPAARPGVVAVLASAFIAGSCSRRLAIPAAALCGAIVWRRWLYTARGNPEAALYPAVEMAHELAANAGVIAGRFEHRHGATTGTGERS